MRPLILLSIVALASLAGYLTFRGLETRSKVTLQQVEKFQQWRAKHTKLYSSPAESDFRMQVFLKKSDEVDSWNTEYEEAIKREGKSNLSGPMFEVNAFSDMTTPEFTKRYTGLNPSLMKPVEETEADSSDIAPSSPSSQKANLGQQAAYQIRVRNQQNCGSCWAFSTVVTIEKHLYDLYKQQVDLSQQELVDCSTEDNGCDGGWPTNTFKYVQNHGIHLGGPSRYSYNAVAGACRSDEESLGGKVYFSDFAALQVSFTMKRVTKLVNEASTQVHPGTAIYSAGRFSSLANSLDTYDATIGGECSTAVDHAVNIIAVGTTFVTLQNSWGTEWAAQGTKKVKPCSDKILLGEPSVLQWTKASAKAD